MTHLHRGHPCTLTVPHAHLADWIAASIFDTTSQLMILRWWPQRRPRKAAA